MNRMKPKKRQKLCYHCEGEVDIDVIVCPFCAADLREEKPEQKYSSYQAIPAQALYPPQMTEREKVEEEEVEPKQTNVFTPTILFTLGVQLFIFGLLMLLFSHKGTVILKWDARFWFFYVFASIPFLVFGYKALSKL